MAMKPTAIVTIRMRSCDESKTNVHTPLCHAVKRARRPHTLGRVTSWAKSLRILAGKTALAHLREEGLALSHVDVLVGAAGGTKFLVLGGLDRVLFPALR